MSRKLLALCCALLAAFAAAGCKTFAGERSTGVIIARRAQIRSSTAIVAADLSEVLRGDQVDIIDSMTAENGERWLLVRRHDAENTEGWIESRNVMPQEVLERSVRLAEEDKGVPAQATGQLRASSNLRYSPDRSNNENILLKLETGASFEIVGWKRVPKPKSSEATESDDAPKAGSAPQGNARRGTGDEQAKVQEEPNELWYKVRLAATTSPAPAGWVLGKQVELTVPSDIIFYRTGREFVAWQRLDNVEANGSAEGQDKSKEVQPGSWVILEKAAAEQQGAADEPDFDRIYVLGYDKTRQEHYTAYRSRDLRGRLPLRVEESSDAAKVFSIRAEDGAEVKEYRFKTYRDDRGHLKVEPQGPLPTEAKRK
ncbi:MAG TPA: hypothetical protein VIP46_00870 [Pyrinomonadaceae bacterium]